MKTQAFFIAVILLFATGYVAKAQSPVVFKYKNNPAYSAYNYKQPNHAKLAEKYALEQRVELNYISIAPQLDINRRNYKVQSLPKQQAQPSGAVIPVSKQKKQVNSAQSPANYKRQFK
jgi:hypothetical protein